MAALVALLLGFGTLSALVVTPLVREDEPQLEAAPATVSAVRRRPRKPVLRIVFPEGFTRREMAERIQTVNRIARRRRKITPSLSARAYLAATARSPLPGRFARDGKARSLEGFLFPATYDFTEDTTSAQLVRMQLDAFQQNWRKLDLRHARSRNLTPYDVVIIASMVEGEARVPRERALVSAVIYNRLRAGLPLGIDATLRYGLRIPANRSLRESELQNLTPYNTRVHAGLPPTPIGNAGLASLRAATRPANVEYLYFVRRADCKTHFFTADEDEFYAALSGPRC